MDCKYYKMYANEFAGCPVTRGDWTSDLPPCAACYFRHGKAVAISVASIVFTSVDDARHGIYRQQDINTLKICLTEERAHMNRKTLTKMIEARIRKIQKTMPDGLPREAVSCV